MGRVCVLTCTLMKDTNTSNCYYIKTLSNYIYMLVSWRVHEHRKSLMLSICIIYICRFLDIIRDFLCFVHTS